MRKRSQHLSGAVFFAVCSAFSTCSAELPSEVAGSIAQMRVDLATLIYSETDVRVSTFVMIRPSTRPSPGQPDFKLYSLEKPQVSTATFLLAMDGERVRLTCIPRVIDPGDGVRFFATKSSFYGSPAGVIRAKASNEALVQDLGKTSIEVANSDAITLYPAYLLDEVFGKPRSVNPADTREDVRKEERIDGPFPARDGGVGDPADVIVNYQVTSTRYLRGHKPTVSQKVIRYAKSMGYRPDRVAVISNGFIEWEWKFDWSLTDTGGGKAWLPTHAVASTYYEIAPGEELKAFAREATVKSARWRGQGLPAGFSVEPPPITAKTQLTNSTNAYKASTAMGGHVVSQGRPFEVRPTLIYAGIVALIAVVFGARAYRARRV